MCFSSQCSVDTRDPGSFHGVQLQTFSRYLIYMFASFERLFKAAAGPSLSLMNRYAIDILHFTRASHGLISFSREPHTVLEVITALAGALSYFCRGGVDTRNSALFHVLQRDPLKFANVLLANFPNLQLVLIQVFRSCFLLLT